MNCMKTKFFLRIVIVVLLGILSIGLFTISRPPFEGEADKIEIRNGKTGDLFTFEGDEKKEVIESLLSFDTKIVGIATWTSGYTYKIEFITGNKSKTVIIQTSDRFKSNGLVYKVDGDIVKVLEDFIKKQTK